MNISLPFSRFVSRRDEKDSLEDGEGDKMNQRECKKGRGVRGGRENERKFIGRSMAGSVGYIYLRGARD